MGVISLTVFIIGAYARHIENSLREKVELSHVSHSELLARHDREDAAQRKRIDDMEERMYSHWEEDARQYVFKKDFYSFAKDVKDSLIRIEEKIEMLRGRE
jgi:hypothetical protein